MAQGASPGEVLAGWLRAERSDFVRFNRSRLRQAGTVERASLELRLMASGRQARHTLTLSGERSADESRVRDAIAGRDPARPLIGDAWDDSDWQPSAPLLGTNLDRHASAKGEDFNDICTRTFFNPQRDAFTPINPGDGLALFKTIHHPAHIF